MDFVAVYNIPGTSTVQISLVDADTAEELQSLSPRFDSPLVLIFVEEGTQDVVDYLHTTFEHFAVEGFKDQFLFFQQSVPEILALIHDALLHIDEGGK